MGQSGQPRILWQVKFRNESLWENRRYQGFPDLTKTKKRKCSTCSSSNPRPLRYQAAYNLQAAVRHLFMQGRKRNIGRAVNEIRERPRGPTQGGSGPRGRLLSSQNSSFNEEVLA